jgi:hypothetical protein
MDSTTPTRNPYPTDVTDDEWAFVAPYLTLMDEAAPNGGTPCARSSTGCASSSAPACGGG